MNLKKRKMEEITCTEEEDDYGGEKDGRANLECLKNG